MLPETTLAQAAALLQRLAAAGLTVATAESCTGGLIAAALTAIPGSSAVVLCGWVTYSNEAKARLLGVPQDVLESHGAVSQPVAAAMAAGALARSGAALALSCTGIAGPGGGRPNKPVGLVFIGLARPGAPPTVDRHIFGGNRAAIRAETVAAALAMADGTLVGRATHG